MSSLAGSTAVVTGGTRGFGPGIVEALADQGMRVVAIARSADDLQALKREAKGNIDVVCGDVTDPVLAARVVEREKPAVLVLNAGARGLNRPTRMHTWKTFSIQYETPQERVSLGAGSAAPAARQGQCDFLGVQRSGFASDVRERQLCVRESRDLRFRPGGRG